MCAFLGYTASARQRGDGTLYMGSIRGKVHRLPHNTQSTSQHTSGAMDESSRESSKMQAHRSSGVVMDIAAFKVSHSIECDIDATALRAV